MQVETEAMVLASGQVSAEEITELERLSFAQLDAARAGDFEEVRVLLGTRQHLFEGLRGRTVRSGVLEPVMASDAETIMVLRAQIRRVEEALARLNTGGRALVGYAMKAPPPPAFLDHVR
jgi:hypothetical protein